MPRNLACRSGWMSCRPSTVQPLQVDVLAGIPAEAGQIGNFLVGTAIGKQIPGVVQQFTADALPLALEGDLLQVTVPTMRTILAHLSKSETAQPASETQMPQIDLVAIMYVHPSSAMGAEAGCLLFLELAMQQVQLLVCCGLNDFCLVIVEVCQS